MVRHIEGPLILLHRLLFVLLLSLIRLLLGCFILCLNLCKGGLSLLFVLGLVGQI